MNRRIFWGGVIAGGALALYLTPFTLFMTARGAERVMDWWALKSRVAQGNAVECETAPAGASTPSGGLTAPLEASERNG